jgi:hypothetical protein
MKAPAVVAYVERNGLLLSCTQKDTGQHCAPGGKVEDGESLIDALTRELLRRLLPGKPVFCLGTSKAGAPRHPLYVPGNFVPVEYRM